MKLAKCFLLIPAALTVALITVTVQAAVPAPTNDILNVMVKNQISATVAQIQKMPFKIACLQQVNGMYRGYHGLNFGLDPQKKSALAIGYSSLMSMMAKLPPGDPGTKVTVNFKHEIPFADEVQLTGQQGLLTAFYKKGQWQTSPARCRRCGDTPTTYWKENSLYLEAQFAPGSPALKLVKLLVDRKDYGVPAGTSSSPMTCTLQ